MAFKLTDEQRSRIRQYIPVFRRYLNSPQASEDQLERDERRRFYGELTKDGLLGMDEALLQVMIAGLWASRCWGNKQYLVDKILDQNGLDKLRREFAELLCADAPVGERYERFLKRVKGLGPASVTEMLSLRSPDECGIWNNVAREALGILGFAGALPVKKYKIARAELERFNDVCRAIALELEAGGLPKPDLLGVDYFLYEVTRVGKRSAAPESVDDTGFDHDEIGDHIRAIGDWLGFEADTRRRIAAGAEVDVLWRAQVGNLGVITYVFEVQHKGSIDSLIVNLQKAKSNPTVQKVVAVSDTKQLEKIRSYTQGLPSEFRDALTFWSVGDVEKVYDALSEAMEIMSRLRLVKDAFPLGEVMAGR